MSIDPRTIAADIMTSNARDITVGEIWGHIGQAYDLTYVDATLANEVAELIATAGIDLIWPDGTTDTELDAARVQIERLRAELADAESKVERLRAALETIAGCCRCTAADCPSAVAREALAVERVPAGQGQENSQ